MPRWADLDAEVALLEAGTAVLAAQGAAVDAAAGLVPTWAARGLYPHERAARVNFARIVDELDRHAGQITDRMVELRGQYADLVEAEFRRIAATDGPSEAAYWLMNVDGPMGLAGVPGAQELIDAAGDEFAGTLRQAAREGFGATLEEAAAQGVPVPGGLRMSGQIARELDEFVRRQALRMASGPLGVATRTMREAAYRLPLQDLDAYVEGVVRAGRESSTRALATDYASAPIHQAHGQGRQVAAQRLPTPANIYASELLDRNTCGPCSLIDGTNYPDLAAARADYPDGRYRECAGGARCRGTLVFVWSTEEGPTGDVPGDRPQPGAGTPGGPELPTDPNGPPVIRLRNSAGGPIQLDPDVIAQFGVELPEEGVTFRLEGGRVHGYNAGPGSARVVDGGRLIFVEDGAAELVDGATAAQRLDEMEALLGTIPEEFAGAVRSLTLARDVYPSAVGGEAIATSDGPRIVFWKGASYKDGLGRGTFDHELGHSTLGYLNRNRGEVAGRMGRRLTAEARDVARTPDELDALLGAMTDRMHRLTDLAGHGLDPGEAWTRAARSDRSRAQRARTRFEELQRQAVDDWRNAGRVGDLQEAIDARVAALTPAQRRTMAPALATRGPEVGRLTGDHPLRPGGLGSWGGREGVGVSDYGSSQPAEDWAEAHRLYLRSRRDGAIASTAHRVDAENVILPAGDLVPFEDLFPARAKYLDALYGPPEPRPRRRRR